MKKYCTDCGSPTEYSIKPPLFCSNCGKSYNNISVPNKVEVKKIESKVKNLNVEADYDYDDDSEGEDLNHVPNISNLQMDLDIPKNKSVKLGSLLGTSNHDQEDIKFNNPVPNKKLSKKKILEDFAKEAGSIRKSKKGK
jgi:hypothetical protein